MRSFRPLSGNKGNQLKIHALYLNLTVVSVPSRGIRVINSISALSIWDTRCVSVPSRGIRVINWYSPARHAVIATGFRPLSGNKGNQLSRQYTSLPSVVFPSPLGE